MKDIYYIKSLEIENIKCFAKNTRIEFFKSKYSKKLSKWNLILGDNGSGKTTLLKCIYLSLADDFYIGKSDDFYNYSRDKKSPAYIKSEICQSLGVNDLVNEMNHENHRRSGFLEEFNIKIIGPSIRNRKKRLPIFAYGATRKSSGFTKNSRFSRHDFGESLFNENSSLISAEEWILEADHIARLKNEQFTPTNVIKILLKLFNGIISDIRVSKTSKVPTAEFKTKYGWVELNQLSLGYKTIISWLVDFTYKLSDFYAYSKDVYKEPAIVIVDEIDLHLHVTFQKQLVEFLTSTFENVQFIVSAHSPLVVQASSNANIILLKRYGSRTKVYKNELDISKWRIDQIYSSELFGNIGSRSDSFSQLISTKSKLLLKNELTSKEELKLQEINIQLDGVPSGQNQAEMEAIELLKKAAKIYKS